MTTSGRQALRLMETWRSIFYTPIYVSVAGGFLDKEGLDVEFSTCPSQFPHPLSALHHDAADIVQSGIMRSIIASDWGAETVPLHFAKINSRDGFFILGRHPQDSFDWESLRGSRVIPVGFSPMPWASLQYALRKHGLEPSDLDLMTGLSLDDAVAADDGGTGLYAGDDRIPTEILERVRGARRMPARLDSLYDNQGLIGHTLIALQVGLWAAETALDFGEALEEVMQAGGDTDTNGTVAGAVLGARYGYKHIPAKWLGCVPEPHRLERLALDLLGVR